MTMLERMRAAEAAVAAALQMTRTLSPMPSMLLSTDDKGTPMAAAAAAAAAEQVAAGQAAVEQRVTTERKAAER